MLIQTGEKPTVDIYDLQ